MFSTPVGRVRIVGMLEAVSFILLVFIAVPMKRIFHLPEGDDAVLWFGSVHGLLFISYATVTFHAWGKGALTAKLVGLAALASLLPFGPFVLDRKLKSVEKPQPDTVEVRG